MKKINHIALFSALLALLLILTGCGKNSEAPAPVEPAINNVPETAAEPAGMPETAAGTERQDGERFESVIVLEGMEETVRYEHVRNETVGFEMDYDYESLKRLSETDQECFISIYDDPENPWNWLGVAYSTQSADAVADSVSAELSKDYDIIKETVTLDRAGSCIRIEASELKGTGRMADQLQVVYVIPAPDGCRIATEHFSIESAEGFGRRFSYILNTLTVINRSSEGKLTDEQAVSAVRKYCFSTIPGLEDMANSGESPVYWDISSSSENETVVVFRSYTGALVHYYIDRVSGDTYVTEFVPGIMQEEQLTGESLNLWDYID